MTDERFAQHNGDALAAKNAALAAIAETDAADGWMFAIWHVRDGQVYLARTTHQFPRRDFELAETQLRAMNAADAAEDLAVAMALPLPFANRISPAVEAVNEAVGKLNGNGLPEIQNDSTDLIQDTLEEKIKKATEDETID